MYVTMSLAYLENFLSPTKNLFLKFINFFAKVKSLGVKIQGLTKIFEKFFLVYFLWPLQNSTSLYGHNFLKIL